MKKIILFLVLFFTIFNFSKADNIIIDKTNYVRGAHYIYNEVMNSDIKYIVADSYLISGINGNKNKIYTNVRPFLYRKNSGRTINKSAYIHGYTGVDLYFYRIKKGSSVKQMFYLIDGQIKNKNKTEYEHYIEQDRVANWFYYQGTFFFTADDYQGWKYYDKDYEIPEDSMSAYTGSIKDYNGATPDIFGDNRGKIFTYGQNIIFKVKKDIKKLYGVEYRYHQDTNDFSTLEKEIDLVGDFDDEIFTYNIFFKGNYIFVSLLLRNNKVINNKCNNTECILLDSDKFRIVQNPNNPDYVASINTASGSIDSIKKVNIGNYNELLIFSKIVDYDDKSRYYVSSNDGKLYSNSSSNYWSLELLGGDNDNTGTGSGSGSGTNLNFNNSKSIGFSRIGKTYSGSVSKDDFDFDINSNISNSLSKISSSLSGTFDNVGNMITLSGASEHKNSIGLFTGSIITNVNDTCEMFNDDGSFRVYGAGVLGISPNVGFNILQGNNLDYILFVPQKIIDFFTSSFNNILSLSSVFSSVPDNSEVCFLGFKSKVEYQKYLKMANEGFSIGDKKLITIGEVTYLDYFVLVVFGIIFVFGFIILFSKV